MSGVWRLRFWAEPAIVSPIFLLSSLLKTINKDDEWWVIFPSLKGRETKYTPGKVVLRLLCAFFSRLWHWDCSESLLLSTGCFQVCFGQDLYAWLRWLHEAPLQPQMRCAARAGRVAESDVTLNLDTVLEAEPPFIPMKAAQWHWKPQKRDLLGMKNTWIFCVVGPIELTWVGIK